MKRVAAAMMVLCACTSTRNPPAPGPPPPAEPAASRAEAIEVIDAGAPDAMVLPGSVLGFLRDGGPLIASGWGALRKVEVEIVVKPGASMDGRLQDNVFVHLHSALTVCAGQQGLPEENETYYFDFQVVIAEEKIRSVTGVGGNLPGRVHLCFERALEGEDVAALPGTYSAAYEATLIDRGR